MMSTKLILGILPGAAAMLFIGTLAGAAEGPATVLEIRDDPAGGKKAVAMLRIAAHPEAVRAVLNDFMRWPELFAGRFELVKLDRQEGRVVTHLHIKRAPLPGYLKMVCETRDMPNGEIVTSLIEGDFRRYLRRWRLVAEENGAAVHTRAEMELSVDPDTWTPGWLFATVLRSDLEEHFVILRERAIARMSTR